MARKFGSTCNSMILRASEPARFENPVVAAALDPDPAAGESSEWACTSCRTTLSPYHYLSQKRKTTNRAFGSVTRVCRNNMRNIVIRLFQPSNCFLWSKMNIN
jgi:hypothetical protein